MIKQLQTNFIVVMMNNDLIHQNYKNVTIQSFNIIYIYIYIYISEAKTGFDTIKPIVASSILEKRSCNVISIWNMLLINLLAN